MVRRLRSLGGFLFSFLLVMLMHHGAKGQSGLCDPIVPFFQVDLTGQPSGTWTSTAVQREGNCCGTTPPDQCIEFELTLDPNTIAINFDIVSGAVPGGALFFQINCGPQQPAGSPVCISGVGPHTITFCKPGNNQNIYQIDAIEAPYVTPDTLTGDGCGVQIGTGGVDLASIQWTDITGNGAYQGFLSCDSGCAVTTVTPTFPYPSQIQYEMCGIPLAGPCYPDPVFCDTVTVTVSPPLNDSIVPNPAAFCSDSAGVLLTSNTVGGVPPYDYVWYDGPQGSGNIVGGSQSYFATASGTYSVYIQDGLSAICPTDTFDVTVTVDPAPIIEAGSAAPVCPTSPDVALSGSATNTPGFIWTGNGSFAPSDTVLNTTYTPTAAEIAAGQATVYLTSVGHPTCAPVVDSVVIQITDSLAIDFTTPWFVCYQQSTTLSATVTGGTPGYTYQWSTGETTANACCYGGGTYTLTVTDNTANSCTVTETLTIFENPQINVAVPDTTVVTCDATASISVTASGGSGNLSYLWSNGQTGPTLTAPIGTYTVVATDTLGCQATDTTELQTTSSSLTVNVPLPDTVCFGETTTLSALVSGGVGPFTYEWSNSSTAPSTTGGVGQYCVTVTDDVGCVSSDCETVIEIPELIATINTPDQFCNGALDTVAVDVTGGTQPYTYSWTTGSTDDYDVVSDGYYEVLVTDASQGSCQDTAGITITYPGPLVMAFGTDSVNCFGGGDGSVIASVIGGIQPYQYSWQNQVSTTNSISNLTEGNYILTVTDSLGCVISDTAYVGEPLPINIVMDSSINISCFGFNDGQAFTTTTGGSPSYVYSWSPGGQTAADPTGLAPGIHTVTVSDQYGCSDQASVQITQPQPLAVNIVNIVNVSCKGFSNGQATASITGGTQPYNIAWSNGTTTAQNTGLIAGTYFVDITDANGCVAVDTVVITEPPPLEIAPVSTDVTCYGYSDGTIAINPTGGTPNYNFVWSPNVSSADSVGGLAPGTYAFMVIDAQSCSVSDSITIVQPDEIIISMSAIDAHCSLPNGAAIVNLDSGGIAPISYQWDASAGSQTTDTASNVGPGTYVVTVSDSGGCFAIDSAVVGDIPPSTAVVANITNVSCNGFADGSVSVSVSGTGTPPYTYMWYDAGAGASIGQTTSTATNLPPGDYYVVVTDSFNCVITSDTATITEPPVLALAASSTNVSCNDACDGTATATVTGGTTPYSLVWDDPLMQDTTVATGLCDGTYQVMLVDANGCIDSASVAITEPFPINLDSVVVNASCGQSSGQGCVIVSGGTQPYNIAWPGGQSSACLGGIPANVYQVTITDANGCQDSIQVEVQDVQGPTIQVTNITDASCFGSCDGDATVWYTSSNPLQSVQWDAGTGSQTTPTASNLCAGGYSVVVTDTAGCSASISVVIDEPDPLQYNLNETDPVCNASCDGTGELIIVGGTQPYSVDWLNGGGTNVGSGQTINGLCAGSYFFSIEDSMGCTTGGNMALVDPLPIVLNETVNNVTCAGACNGTATINVQNGTQPYFYQWDAAAQNQIAPTATNLCAGSYTCVVTDINGCQASITVNVTEPDTLVLNIANYQDVTCNNACDGWIEASYSGGTPPYSVQWSSGQTVDLVTGLCAGNYCVTVTDANGCQQTQCVTIAEPTPLVTSVYEFDVSCNGLCDGYAGAQVSGSVPPYSYQWSINGNPTSPNVTNLCPGNYNLHIEDQNGCSFDSIITITQPPAITASIATTDATCGQQNGEACATVSGGITPHDYIWNDPYTQTTPCADSLAGGCYNLTITDANFCQLDTLICINNASGPTVTNLGSGNVTCAGAANGFVNFDVTGGTGAVSHTIINAQGTVVSTGSTTASGLSGGCYTLTSVDATGCSASSTICISEPTPISIFFNSSSNVSCAGACDGAASAIVSGGTTPYNVSWSSGSSPNGLANSGLCAGSHTITITDANGCVQSETITITEPNVLQLSTTKTDILCAGDCNGQIAASSTGGTGPYSYSWNPVVSTGANATGLCAGPYVVTVTDLNGCQETETVNINEPNPLTASSVSINATCSQCNGAGSLNTSGGVQPYSFDWLGSGSNPSSATNPGLCPGTHVVEISDANGCQITDTVSVTNEPGPTIDGFTVVQPSCSNNTDGSISVTASSPIGLPITNYQWDAAAGNQTTQTAVALTGGTYCVTVEDVNGCQVTGCDVLTSPAPVVAIGDLDTTICSGTLAQLWAGAQGGTAPYTIIWDPSTGFGNSTGPVNVTPANTTQYCFTAQDANGCASPPECIIVDVHPPITLTTSPPALSICSGQTADLFATATGGDGSGYTFDWVDQNGTPLADSVSGDTTFLTVTPTQPSLYIVSVVDGCNNIITDTIPADFGVQPTANLTAMDSVGCVPFLVDFDVQSDVGTSFEFDFDCDGIIDYAGPNSSPSHIYTDTGNYNVCVNVIGPSGCETQVDAQGMITVLPPPQADFEMDPNAATLRNPVIHFTNTSTGAYTLEWDFGDGMVVYDTIGNVIDTTNTSGVTQELYHEYTDTGTYQVTLTITNLYGCTSTITYEVVIDPEYMLFAPNAFTPDGDGKNEVFIPLGIGIAEEGYRLMIFNRWGQLLFETAYKDVGWDGTYNGVMSKPDVYVWKVEAYDLWGELHTYYGHVTLLR